MEKIELDKFFKTTINNVEYKCKIYRNDSYYHILILKKSLFLKFIPIWKKYYSGYLELVNNNKHVKIIHDKKWFELEYVQDIVQKSIKTADAITWFNNECKKIPVPTHKKVL